MFIHPSSDVQSKQIGEGTRVWQYVVILPGAVIGRDGNICSHCFIENKVIVGDRVTVKCGVQLWDGVTLEDDVFIAPCVTTTNDNFMGRTEARHGLLMGATIRRAARIGGGVVILPGIEIGEEAFVAAGALVTKDIPAGKLVAGLPARVWRDVPEEELLGNQ